MSEWITDRLPEMHEQTSEGEVWVFDEYKEYVIRNYQDIVLGTPWCEIEPPKTYGASNRWQMEWDSRYHQWLVRDAEGHIGAVLCSDSPSPEKYREAAERVAAIYNEVVE